MRYLSLFSGIEAASVAWEPMGWEPMAFAEIEEFPCAVLRHHWPDVPNLGDVCKVDWGKFVEEYGRPDVLAGGSPCFTAGTLVLCEEGYKPIEQVKVGDMVATHKGRLCRVVRTGHKEADVGDLKVHGMMKLTCTPDHPILTSRRTKCDKDASGCWFRFHGEEFVSAKDSVDLMACSVPVVEADIPEFPDVYGLPREDILELIGWYLGDGSIAGKGKKNPTLRTLQLAISPKKLVRFVVAFKQRLHYRVRPIDDERCMVDIYNTELCRFIEKWFGKGAENKNLPAWVYALSEDERRRLFKGYTDTDGTTYEDGRIVIESVSKALIVGMQVLMRGGSTVFLESRGSTVIKGVEYNVKPTYRLSYREGRSNCWEDNGYVKRRIVSYGNIRRETVYNLEVEGDHSYWADAIAVHNCQSFSIAAGSNRTSLDGKSNLMWQYIRACREILPDWLIWENVPGVLNTKDNAFAQLLDSLQDVGYVDLAWRVLDSQFVRVAERDDRGAITGWVGPVAQRRRRVFLVGHLGEGGGAAAVLFERESMRGHTQTSKQKRQELAGAAGRGPSQNSGGGGVDLTAFKYSAGAAARTMPTYDDGSCNTLTADYHSPAVCKREQCYPINAETTPKLGDDGDPAYTMRSRDRGGGINDVVCIQGGGKTSLSGNGSGVSNEGVSYTLNLVDEHAVAFDSSEVYSIPENAINLPNSGTNGPIAYDGDQASPTLRASKSVPAVSFASDAYGLYLDETIKVSDDISPTIRRGGDGGTNLTVAFAQNTRDEVRWQGDGTISGALSANPGMKQETYVMTPNPEAGGGRHDLQQQGRLPVPDGDGRHEAVHRQPERGRRETDPDPDSG